MKSLFLGMFSSVYLSIGLSFMVYSLVMGFLIYFFPSLMLGITRLELSRFPTSIGFK